MAKKLNGLRNLVPTKVLGLGTFVVFPDDPFRAFFNPPGTPLEAFIEAIDATDQDARGVEGSAGVSLTEIFSAGCKLSSEASVDLEAATSTLQTLLNYDDWFETVCKTKEARRWFERQLEKYGAMELRLHFVIALQTVKNASLVLKGSDTVEAQITAQVPISQVLGDPGVLSPLLDPSATADIKLIKASGQRFSVAEAVHAVKYAEVRFEYLSSRKLANLLGKKTLDKVSLETSTRWNVMGTDAGGASEGEEEGSDADAEEVEDIIEAKLCVDEDSE
jgi:hypothetical protein